MVRGKDGREDFGPGYQRLLVRPAPDEAVGSGQSVYEPAADRLDVECRTTFDAELRLQQARGARKDIVRSRGRDHDEIDLACVDARSLQRAAACLQSEVA